MTETVSIPSSSSTAATSFVSSSDTLPRTMPSLPPLHLAAQMEDVSTLSQILTANDADPNLLDFQGLTPLHHAAMADRMIAAKMLLENGARVDTKGGQAEATPLHFACG